MPGGRTAPTSEAAAWRDAFALDLHALALFRIALGLCLVADLVHRLGLIRTFYSDRGPMPREAVFQFADPWAISLNFLGGGWELQTFLVGAAILFALGFTTGYRTRLCAVAAWLLLSSVHARDPLILGDGDVLLRLLLFWSILLPVNGRLSLDRSLNPEAPTLASKHVSIASVALILQITAVYWVSAAGLESSAAAYAFSNDTFATGLGRSLLAYPGLLPWLATGTLALAIAGPLLVPATAWSPRLRVALVAVLLGFHLALGLTLRAGLLPWVLSAAWLALLPGEFRRRLPARVDTLTQRLRGWAGLLAARLRQLPGTRFTVPPAPREPGKVTRLVAIGAVAIIVLTLPERDAAAEGLPVREPGLASKLASLTQLGQRWTWLRMVTSPEHGWYVFEGVLDDGSRIDLWNRGGVPSEARPADLAAWYRSAEWTRYLTRLRDPRYSEFRLYAGLALCLEWNEHLRKAERIQAVDTDLMLEATAAPGRQPGPPVRVQGWRQRCPQLPPYPLTWWF